ncbi:MAG: YCF48-related protein, partial [Terriglobales bacterium]
LTSDGTLQRSLDFGRSWQTIPVASQASFRALAASGKDIWVGGTKGALYHSTDAGQNWVQVQPVAAGQALTDDLIGVEFPDAMHGKVTTSAKETWTTEDGGQSWNKQ